ncbi:MAG: zf-HC2 domain-containing protein, partial [Longimicrobiales bacterium]
PHPRFASGTLRGAGPYNGGDDLARWTKRAASRSVRTDMQAKQAASGGGSNRGIDCGVLLDRHTDYVDGRLTPLEQLRIRAHLASCESCARYDRVVRRSGELLGELPRVDVSGAFGDRLRRRLVATGPVPRDASGRTAARVPFAAALLLLAGGLAAAALGPGLGPLASPTDDADRARLGVVAAGIGAADGVASSLDVHRPSPPLFLPSLAHLGTADATAPLFVRVSAELSATPGPYSPLVVTPPALRSAIASAATAPRAAE